MWGSSARWECACRKTSANRGRVIEVRRGSVKKRDDVQGGNPPPMSKEGDGRHPEWRYYSVSRLGQLFSSGFTVCRLSANNMLWAIGPWDSDTPYVSSASTSATCMQTLIYLGMLSQVYLPYCTGWNTRVSPPPIQNISLKKIPPVIQRLKRGFVGD